MFDQILPATDPVLMFALLMLTALLAPRLAESVKLPGIIGLIVAGILIGPHGLGILERGSEVELLSTIGLLYLMFLAGLELDLDQFIRHRLHSLTFGLLTFAIPLILGTLMGRYLLGFSWPASILLSTMFSSHTLITYPLASRLGLARQRAVTTTIGGTLITDTLALLFLAVIAASYRGDASVLFWAQMSLLMVAYALAVVFMLPPLTRWFFRHIASDGIIAYTGVIAAVFLCAHLAHVAGLEPIIGAFLAGLTINSFIPENSTLMNRIQFVGHSLFIPFFLISVGMLVNVGLFLTGGEAALIAVSMVIAGIVTKWMAANASQKLLSYTNDEGMLIYGLSVNQAAATLAAVMVGFRIGIFSEHVVTGTIVMILVTSLAGSWLTDRYARRVALREESKPYSPSGAPQRILISLANPETAEELMNFAKMIRRANSHEPLYPLSVVESGAHPDERIAEAEKLLVHAAVRATSSDIPVVPTTRTAIDIPSGVLQAMTDLRTSTAILGWKGSVSFHSQTFGHKLDIIVERSRQMILISRCSESINTVKRIILAVPPLLERQTGFARSVQMVKTLSQQLGGSLLSVSVPSTMDKMRYIITETPPRITEKEVLLDQWDEFLTWAKKNVSSTDDLLILFNARKGKLAWRPINNKMPRLLIGQQPDMNLVVVYPPEISEEEGSETEAASVSDSHLVLMPQNVELDLKGTTVSGAVERLLQSTFASQREVVERVAGYLTAMGEKEPAELAPGVVLLHAHIPEVSRPTAFFGLNRDGWEMPQVTADVRALFLLLSPQDAPPEVHLNALSELIVPLRTTETLEELFKAEDVEKIFDLWKHLRS